MKTPTATDGFYHVYNRGVLKNAIFLDKYDYGRFVDSLRDFNDSRRVDPRRRTRRQDPSSEPRIPFVSILAWCLMPNHFHLLLKQRIDDGIPRFMHKLGDGYTKYINKEVIDTSWR